MIILCAEGIQTGPRNQIIFGMVLHMKRKIVCILALLLMAVLCFFGAFRLWACGSRALPLGVGVDDISITAGQFRDALNEWDHETIEGMINGYSSVNFDYESDSALENKLHDCLADSFDCDLKGEATVKGMNAWQDIEVSYFAFALAADDIKEHTQKHYDQLLESGQDNDDLYDENGNLLESVAMELYEDAVEYIISDSENYRTSRRFTLEFVYENSRWELKLSDELIDTLLGNVVSQ